MYMSNLRIVAPFRMHDWSFSRTDATLKRVITHVTFSSGQLLYQITSELCGHVAASTAKFVSDLFISAQVLALLVQVPVSQALVNHYHWGPQDCSFMSATDQRRHCEGPG